MQSFSREDRKATNHPGKLLYETLRGIVLDASKDVPIGTLVHWNAEHHTLLILCRYLVILRFPLRHFVMKLHYLVLHVRMVLMGLI